MQSFNFIARDLIWCNLSNVLDELCINKVVGLDYLKNISQYGLNALHKWLCLFHNINTSEPGKYLLLDCLVAKELNYGCGIWGYKLRKDIETVHTFTWCVKINQPLCNG